MYIYSHSLGQNTPRTKKIRSYSFRARANIPTLKNKGANLPFYHRHRMSREHTRYTMHWFLGPSAGVGSDLLTHQVTAYVDEKPLCVF